MIQVKVTVISCITQEVPTIHNYPIQCTIKMLVTMPDGSQFVTQKIIHEPMWYQRKYRLQVFSRKEKKIVPMKEEFDSIGSMEVRYRTWRTESLAVLSLGLVDYNQIHPSVLNGTVWISLIKSGTSFYAFLGDYRGKPSISRYYCDRTRGGEVFPEPFDVWYEPETVDKYLQSIEVPDET